MNEDRPPSFLDRWKRQRKQAPRMQEAADVGTAFGLEMSLDPAPAADPRAPGQGDGEQRWTLRWWPAGKAGS